MRPSSLLIAVSLALLTTACITTTEAALAPNVVRLDTQARGALFTSQTMSQTMRKAAEVTLGNGYTHFSISDGNRREGAVYYANMANAAAYPS